MSDGRRNNGGARANVGRKPNVLRREMAEMFEATCDAEKRGLIIEMMSIAARSGNVRAATFLFDRYYGKPETADHAELVTRLQQFMETVVTAITQEVDADTRERILTRLRQSGLDCDVE
jgi:hypothetical protein